MNVWTQEVQSRTASECFRSHAREPRHSQLTCRVFVCCLCFSSCNTSGVFRYRVDFAHRAHFLFVSTMHEGSNSRPVLSSWKVVATLYQSMHRQLIAQSRKCPRRLCALRTLPNSESIRAGTCLGRVAYQTSITKFTRSYGVSFACTVSLASDSASVRMARIWEQREQTLALLNCALHRTCCWLSEMIRLLFKSPPSRHQSCHTSSSFFAFEDVDVHARNYAATAGAIDAAGAEDELESGAAISSSVTSFLTSHAVSL